MPTVRRHGDHAVVPARSRTGVGQVLRSIFVRPGGPAAVRESGGGSSACGNVTSPFEADVIWSLPASVLGPGVTCQEAPRA
jgi:hypothetical protein